MKFIKKLTNNRGAAEPVFFIIGIFVVLLILFFATDLIDNTWQKYILQREVGNVSRQYAVDWPETLYNPNCVSRDCSYASTNQSTVVQNMVKLVANTGRSARFDTLVVAISTTPFNNIDPEGITNCSSFGSNTVLCIRYNVSTDTATVGKQWSIDRFSLNATDEAAKPITYGTDLYVIGIGTYTYNASRVMNPGVRTVWFDNKFASERFGVYEK